MVIPSSNVFAAWEPPKQFVNRYAWRDSCLYKQLVRQPQDRLLKALPPKTQLRYSEIRALVGGVTAIQGTGGQARTYADEPLVRNEKGRPADLLVLERHHEDPWENVVEADPAGSSWS
jgi:hypothetical protein